MFLFRRKKQQQDEPKREDVGLPSRPEKAAIEAEGEVTVQTRGKLPLDLLPFRSEKALELERDGTYVFVMGRAVSKPSIKREIEGLYGVRVEKIRIARLPAKARRRGQHINSRPMVRKAIVKVRHGERIDFGI